MYDDGEGVPKDIAEAVRWFRLAADQGDVYAQYNLGVKYVKGEGVPQDSAEAVRWFRLAADQGAARAQCHLGFMYENGKGVPADDDEAVKWYRLAAEQGSPTAQANVVGMYLRGDGLPPGDAEALEWCRLVTREDAKMKFLFASGGSALGDAFPHDAAAVKLFREAAELGNSEAQCHLGEMYADGHGVPQDYIQAHMWFNLAAAGGEAKGSQGRSMVAEQMTPTEIAEAQRLARNWQPTRIEIRNSSPPWWDME
jgi:hypothetical protein